MRVITVRWMDGDIEEFEVKDKVRLSTGLLFFKLNDTGRNRHVPLCNVRWYSIYPETHEDLSLALFDGREPLSSPPSAITDTDESKDIDETEDNMLDNFESIGKDDISP